MFAPFPLFITLLVSVSFCLTIGLINELVVVGDDSNAYARKLNRMIRIEW
jgi:hypothetical protein